MSIVETSLGQCFHVVRFSVEINFTPKLIIINHTAKFSVKIINFAQNYG